MHEDSTDMVIQQHAGTQDITHRDSGRQISLDPTSSLLKTNDKMNVPSSPVAVDQPLAGAGATESPPT